MLNQSVLQAPIREIGSLDPQAAVGGVTPAFGEFLIPSGISMCVKRIEGHLFRDGAAPGTEFAQIIVRDKAAPNTIFAMLTMGIGAGQFVTTGASGNAQTGFLIPTDDENDRTVEILAINVFSLVGIVAAVAKLETYVPTPGTSQAYVPSGA